MVVSILAEFVCFAESAVSYQHDSVATVGDAASRPQCGTVTVTDGFSVATQPSRSFYFPHSVRLCAAADRVTRQPTVEIHCVGSVVHSLRRTGVWRILCACCSSSTKRPRMRMNITECARSTSSVLWRPLNQPDEPAAIVICYERQTNESDTRFILWETWPLICVSQYEDTA